MSDVYRRFLDDELALEEAAELLRALASSKVAPGSLSLDALSDERREKASQLFNATIRPILDPYFAGEVASDVTARRLAPLVRPVGVFALNVNLPPGPGADEAMKRLMDLTDRVADLESPAEERE